VVVEGQYVSADVKHEKLEVVQQNLELQKEKMRFDWVQLALSMDLLGAKQKATELMQQILQHHLSHVSLQLLVIQLSTIVECCLGFLCYSFPIIFLGVAQSEDLFHRKNRLTLS